MTTRVETPEGFVKAHAIVTRAGLITYARGELGLSGPADEMVVVNRTVESLSHPDTLASLRGAPVTLGHPPGGVNPSNWKAESVGSVAGEPRLAGDVILVDLMVGDRDALKRLDEGVDELSIGYDMMLGSDHSTRGPLRINHVAIVERGRAGSSVRVLDSLEDDGMEKKEMMDAFAEAFDMGMNKHRPNMGDAFDAEGMKKSFMDAFSPVMDAFKEMKDAQDKALTAADEAKATADAKAAGELLVNATRAEERERFAVLTDAMPFIAEDQREALRSADVSTILLAAVGDGVPDADKQNVSYLRGALNVAFKQTKDSAATWGSGIANDGLPAGVKAFDGARPVTATDARAKAQADYEAMISKRYADSGGI